MMAAGVLSVHFKAGPGIKCCSGISGGPGKDDSEHAPSHCGRLSRVAHAARLFNACLIQSLNCWIDTLATAQRARVFRHFFDFAHRRPRYAIFRILRDERFKHCATIP